MLSGNRNFEGRINPHVRTNYLASPPLVVAYALAGTMDIDLDTEPLGHDRNGKPVFLKDVWPTQTRPSARRSASTSKPDQFRNQYAHALDGSTGLAEAPHRQRQLVPVGSRRAPTSASRPSSTKLAAEPAPLQDLAERARAGGPRRLGDHRPHLARPATSPKSSPAARYLMEQGVEPKDFNSYGAAAATTR